MTRWKRDSWVSPSRWAKDKGQRANSRCFHDLKEPSGQTECDLSLLICAEIQLRTELLECTLRWLSATSVIYNSDFAPSRASRDLDASSQVPCCSASFDGPTKCARLVLQICACIYQFQTYLHWAKVSEPMLWQKYIGKLGNALTTKLVRSKFSA